METSVLVDSISKQYNINHLRGGYVALRDILGNMVRDPIGAAKYRWGKITGQVTTEEFWALKDVSFSVEKGEAVGIIGSNGAGKSTLLKILTRITPPTSGTITLNGRVSSLLEVGTGFHPELTGRENIFLNGAILGMPQREIRQKFDAIVDFSGVEKFLDTPVKRYSSGMYVRLAFAVAAHMEPDILLVDEVLAVGDANFQKKCLGKMDEVTREAGRTVLFVSHNMNAIQSLCKRAVLLDNGQVKMIGPTKEVIDFYLGQQSLGTNLTRVKNRKGDGHIRLTTFFVESKGKKIINLETGGMYDFCFGYENLKKGKLHNLSVTVQINSDTGVPIMMGWTKYTNQDFKTAPNKGTIRFRIKQRLPLSEGLYQVSVRIASDEGSDWIKNLGMIEVKEGDFYNSGFIDKHAPIYFEQEWDLSEAD